MQEEVGIETAYAEDEYMDIDLQRALDSLSEQDKAIIIMKFLKIRSWKKLQKYLTKT